MRGMPATPTSCASASTGVPASDPPWVGIPYAGLPDSWGLSPSVRRTVRAPGPPDKAPAGGRVLEQVTSPAEGTKRSQVAVILATSRANVHQAKGGDLAWYSILGLTASTDSANPSATAKPSRKRAIITSVSRWRAAAGRAVLQVESEFTGTQPRPHPSRQNPRISPGAVHAAQAPEAGRRRLLQGQG